MVFFIDEGSEFKGSLDRVWKLAQSEMEHKHSFQKNVKTTMEGENPVMSFDAQTPNGGWVKQTLKMTLVPPIGFSLEYVDGDFAGSKSFQYYIPKGNKTGVTVVGDVISKSLPPEMAKKMVLKQLETAFNEDQENLKRV